MTSILYDPSVLLTVFVILLPIAFELDNRSAIIEYLTNPVFLICLSLMIILEFGCLIISPSIIKIKQQTKRKKTKRYDVLRKWDYIASRWYLVNGLIYHSLLDPFSGFFQSWSLMTKQYNYLDTRFADPYAVGNESATLTVWLEGVLMCPLCIICFIGYRYILPRHRLKIRSTKTKSKRNNKIVWLHCCEFIVLLAQLIGTYFFYGTEMVLMFTGKKTNIPYEDPTFQFGIWQLFYFWFAWLIVAQIWIFVPIILMYNAYKQILLLVKPKRH